MMEPTREQLADLARQIAATRPEELDCDAVLERIAAYLEADAAQGRQSPELAAVGQHLEICPNCRAEFEALLRALDEG